MTYSLKRQDNGALAVFSTESGETMHPVLGPWGEANQLYVQSGALAERLARPPSRHAAAEVVVFDVGLGGAANALAAVACHQELHGRGQLARPLHLVSFERDPETVPFTIANAQALGYPRGHEPELSALLAEGRVSLPGGLTWELRLGDFVELIQAEPLRAELVFFDPYSLRANPGMWSVPTLTAVRRCQRPGGSMELITYSTAFGVRAALLLAGFYVGEGPRLSPRRRTTIASTAFSALGEPLDPGWLSRWRRDRAPWPPLAAPEAHKKLRQALVEHPQWSQFPQPAPDRHVPARRPSGARGAVPGRTGQAGAPARRPRTAGAGASRKGRRRGR